MTKKKSSIDLNKKELSKKIADFDKKNLLLFFNKYSKLASAEAIEENPQYKNELIKKIKENYYTFQPEAKNKKFAFIKTIVYRQLFKYLHKQIHFNDYIRSIVEIFNEDLEKNKKEIELISAQESNSVVLDSRISAQESNSVVLDSRINAIYEIQKRSIIGNKQIRTSPSSAIFYSQFGEDRWIINNLKVPNKGFFIDVGAADGITFSNTYYFEKKGWDGICFEPNPENYLLAKKLRKQVEQIAIDKNTGSAYLEINEVSPDWSQLIDTNQLGVDKNTIPIKTKTLKKVIYENKIKAIDLLSVDVEGWELEVLQSFDILKIQPKIIIVEHLTHGKKLQKRKLLKFFENLPYVLAHETSANFIFKLKE